MATKKRIDDNAAAAHMYLEDAGSKIAKHADTMKGVIEALTAELEEEKARAAAAAKVAEDKYARDTERLNRELIGVRTEHALDKEKLRKVQATLA